MKHRCAFDPFCPTDVLISPVQNMHRNTRKMVQLDWILLSDIQKHLRNKYININLIGTQLIFPFTFGANEAIGQANSRFPVIENTYCSFTCSPDACGYLTSISSPIESFVASYGAYFAHCI